MVCPGMSTTVRRASVALVVVALLAACSSSPTSGGVRTVSIDQGPQTLLVGDQVAFTASVEAAAGLDTAVAWSSSAVDVATIDADGVLVAVGGGAAEVVATSAVDDTVRDAVTVTVVAPGAAAVSVASNGSYVTFSDVIVGPPDLASGTRSVGFGVGWDDAWRGPARPTWVADDAGWDAVWLFVKVRVDGGPWRHARLAADGHGVPADAELDVSGDGMGAFLYRATPGYAAWRADGVELRWAFGADGVDVGADVELRLHAIEMVHVATGPYALGSGGTDTGGFRDGGSVAPFLVVDAGPIEVGSAAGQLNWTPAAFTGAGGGEVPAAFPNGFEAFYLMKRPVTLGQYADFLNGLTAEQAAARAPLGTGARFDLGTGVDGAFTTSLPYQPMQWLSWADGAAFSDWAGLRPMTELEYEKAARGPVASVAGEYAWGTASVTAATGLIAAGTRDELPTPATANATFAGALSPAGPVRAGGFAVPRASRQAAGAGYYGALELSGNLWERVVTVGNEAGRAFTGAHGDGALDAAGDADVAGWPGSDAVGAGFRGGTWRDEVALLRTSDRFYAALTLSSRADIHGWRAARTAP